MRAGLSLLLLAACKDEPTELTGIQPAEISARAGHTLCLQGARLPKQGRVFFGDVDAGEAARDADGRLCLESPALLAGVYDVRLGEEEDAPTLPAGLSVVPLALTFVEAAAHYLPEPGTPIAGGVALDVDVDGIEDVVLFDVAGELAVWRSAGTGAFTALPPPTFDGAVGGLAVARTGAGPVLFACMADGAEARVFRPGTTGLTRAEAPPAEVGRCQGVSAADLDGDGRDEVLVLRPGGVRIWTATPDGLARFGAAEATDAESCGTLRAEDETTPDCLVLDGRATFWAEGEGAARLRLPLPPLVREDAGLTLTVGGDLAAVEVVDAEGARFSIDTTGVPEAPAPVVLPPVGSWAAEGADPPALPLAHLSLVLHPAGETVSLTLTDAWVDLEAGGRARIVDYAPRPLDMDVVGHGAVASAPGQVAVLTAEGPVLREGDAAGWRPGAPGALPETGCVPGAATPLDADGDGRDELFLACAGQDRLLRGDGTGRWFDDTLASLPVDAGDGRGAMAADLDRDGLPELLVATEAGVDRLYRGDGARFEDWSARLGLRDGSGRTVLALDVDQDGDLDVLVLNGAGEGARLLVQAGD